MQQCTTSKAPPLILLISGISILVFPLGAVGQKPPAGAEIPIPTISIGTDGIKLNIPRAPGGPGMGPGGPGGARPTTGTPAPPRVSDEAELEAFRRALDAQATPIQVSAYLSLVNSTRVVVSKFEDLRVLLGMESVSSDLSAKKLAFDESLEKIRTSTKTFLESFSERQRVALKEVTSKFVGANSRLADRTKALGVRIADVTTNKGELVASSNKVEEALASFREQQRLLGKAMYALPDPEEEQPIFTLPASTNSATIGSQTIAVRTSGTIFRTPAERLSSVVHLQIVANLGDLQQSITPVLQSLLAHSDPCGERVTVQQAMVSTASPTTDVWMQLHLERWTCMGPAGTKAPVALMEGNGAIIVKITPAIQKDGSLVILARTEAVEASGVLAEMLRSGSLGDVVLEKIKDSFCIALQKGLDLNMMLHPVRSDSGAIETAKFVRDSKTGTLAIALDGHLRPSAEQVAVLDGQKSESSTTQGSSQR